MYMESSALPLSLATPTLQVSFPATGLHSLLMSVGQAEWSKRAMACPSHFPPFCLLVAKCWCYSSKLHTWYLYLICVQVLLTVCPWSLMDRFLSSYTIVSALILLRNRSSKGVKLFSEKSSSICWSQQLSATATTTSSSNNISENRLFFSPSLCNLNSVCT